MPKNHDSQDWNYLLHFGTFKRMLLEGKIEEDAIFDEVNNNTDVRLGIEDSQKIAVANNTL